MAIKIPMPPSTGTHGGGQQGGPPEPGGPPPPICPTRNVLEKIKNRAIM